MRHSFRAAALAVSLLAIVWIGSIGGCSGWLARSEGIDPATLPVDVVPDYTIFAQRCSKCHSLARPLSSGIDDDEYWAMYVARMRRQPASGITQEDTVKILRFLHYYSEQLRAKKAHREPVPASTLSAPAPAPPSAAPSVQVAPVPVPASPPIPSPAPSSTGIGDAGGN
jgi:hypothetical protein